MAVITMAEMTREFLDLILPTVTDGWLTGNVGYGGHFTATGKYTFDTFEPYAFRWPAQAEAAVAHIRCHAVDADVYFCPYLMKTAERIRGNAAWRALAHCDLDGGDVERARALGAMVLGSGTPGHAHAYWALKHTLTQSQHERLLEGLAAHLGGDRGKVRDNDLLRPPGVFNLKAVADGGLPQFVSIADGSGVTAVDPFGLAAEIGVDINATAPSAAAAVPTGDADAREAADLDGCPRVRDELANASSDRSQDTYRIVCACIDSGLNLAQTRWVIDSRADLAARVVEFLARGRDDVAECWERACAEWPRDPHATPSTPVPAAAGAEGPARFFGPNGLYAQYLADEVMRGVTCGFGYPDERFYTYRDGVWTVGERPIRAEITRCLVDRYRITHTRTVLDLIEHSPNTTPITDTPLADFVNVPNGMVRWESGAMLPHNPGYRSTVQLPVEYVPGARCPRFEAFLAEVLPPDLLAPAEGGPGFIWELIGYTLYSGNPLHVAVLLYGKGRNGKGTLIRVLKALLGENNISSVSLHELIENKFRAATLFHKIANLAGDLDSKWLENTALFKKITGQDGIQGENKYASSFEFNPWALPFYSTNKAFGSPDSSEGWVARWIVVPFPNSFLGHEDRALTTKLTSEAELRGILARAIKALPALMARGNFADLPSLAEAKASFVVASDTVRAWLDEYCEMEFDAWLPRADLYAKYRWHVALDGSKLLSAREFYNRIEQIGGVSALKTNGVRGFTGIRMKAI